MITRILIIHRIISRIARVGWLGALESGWRELMLLRNEAGPPQMSQLSRPHIYGASGEVTSWGRRSGCMGHVCRPTDSRRYAAKNTPHHKHQQQLAMCVTNRKLIPPQEHHLFFVCFVPTHTWQTKRVATTNILAP